MESEVVSIKDELFRIDPDAFVFEELNIEDYMSKVKATPSLGFNAHQRLYTALRMFGASESRKPWNIPRWNFLDYKVEKRGKPTFGAIYGHEKAANQFMEYLHAAIVKPQFMGKAILFYGPTATAKTNLVEIMADTLDAYGTLPQGEIYSVQFDVSEHSDMFGGLKTIRCPAHENPLNFVKLSEAGEFFANINQEMVAWQQISANHTRCPSCSHVISELKKEKINFYDIMKVIKLNPFTEVKAYETRPKDIKSYDSAEIFGGSVDFARFAQLGGRRNNPLVLNFGRMGGMIEGFSSQRHITKFSEMYKNAEDTKFLDSLLDVIHSRTVVPNGHTVYLDTVMIGTTNLSEYEGARRNANLAEYLQRRIHPIEMSSLLVMDDLTKALNSRVYGGNNGLHIPPQFVSNFLSVLGVVSALDEPESELKISLLQKAKIYNGEVPHGVEKELQAIHEELIRIAHNKPFGQKTEGIKYGLPFTFYQDLLSVLTTKAQAVPLEIRSGLKDKRYENGCIALLPFQRTLEDVVNGYDGINDDTRGRIISQALPIALDEYKTACVQDVRRAILGEETIVNIAVKYLTQAYAEATGRNSYTTAKGLEEHIDDKFLGDVEKLSGVRNPSEFRTMTANNVKYRKGDFSNASQMYNALARAMIKENPTFRRAMEQYAQDYILPGKTKDVTVLFSETNTELLKSLYAMGYCRICASAAISIASESRTHTGGCGHR